MATRHVNILRYGSAEDLPEQIELRAGPLAMIYVDGDLRYIRLGEREVLRRIYVAVRDHNWRTIPATLRDLTIEQRQESFEIRYRALHQEGAICFQWDATLRGAPTGVISFEMDGEACGTFMSNRIGICVLHPMQECAGAPCRVTHTDGHTTAGALPFFISPHQPYKDIRAFAHQVSPGCWAEVQFEGEVFEMEDQRNWTDASFKTYGTPLELPFPVRVGRGTHLRQAVSLGLQGSAPSLRPRLEGGPIVLSLGDLTRTQRPSLGLVAVDHGQPMEAIEIQRLRELHLGHLRIDVRSAEDSAQILGQVAPQAMALGAGLEIGLPLVRFDAKGLRFLAEEAGALVAPIVRWLLLTDGLGDEAEDIVALARDTLARTAPEAAFVVGVDAYFAELNRNRPLLGCADGICYSLNPQVHAFDNLSLVETLPAQAATIESARQMAPGKPVIISPVTLRPRYNPNATSPEGGHAPDGMPASVDTRQMSLLGAGWTLVSLKHLMGHPSVQSLTFFETTGWRGVMERPQGAPSRAFPSRPGEAFPLYHVLRWLGKHCGAALRQLRSLAPLQVDGLALQGQQGLCIGLANLTNSPQQVALAGVGAPLRAIVLDEANVEQAMAAPESLEAMGARSIVVKEGLALDLAPYAVAWLSEVRGPLAGQH